MITAYCVPQKDSSTPGSDTAFMQQKRILTLKGNLNPKPRAQWARDLDHQIATWIAEGAEIYLGTDANADVDDSEFQLIITQFSVFVHEHINLSE